MINRLLKNWQYSILNLNEYWNSLKALVNGGLFFNQMVYINVPLFWW
jgi:hypothetical protein